MEQRLSRRDLLRGCTRNAAAIPPPGFFGLRHEACSACTECIDHCPTSIVIVEDGMPSLDFSRGECLFCGECEEHCPHSERLFGAPRAFAHVVEITTACLPRYGIDCQACRDHCPTAAIRFRPRLGGPFLPEIDEDACSGCGACIGVCPVDAVSIKKTMEMSDA